MNTIRLNDWLKKVLFTRKMSVEYRRRLKTARMVLLLVAGACAATARTATAGTDVSDYPIRVNTAGYLPQAPKVCFMQNPPQAKFVVQRSAPDVRWHTVYEGQWIDAGQGIKKGDFSALREPGDYRILCGPKLTGEPLRMHSRFPGQQSYHFPIRKGAYDTVERLLLLYVNWQRCGSRKGWSGLCHQDLVPLLDSAGKTVGRLDARGGYHQSCDLRNWHDGISMSLYGLLRYAELKKPLWDSGELADEIKWGCDYFLRVMSPEGYVYDAQFAPIGWGPRHYYVAPATLGAQCNCAILFARAARFFRSADAAYAARLTEASQRLWRQIEDNPFFEVARPAPEKNLPPGAQPAEKCYPQQYRTSVNGFAERAMTALELFRTTRDSALADVAKKYGGEMLNRLITTGPEAGFYRDAKGKNGHAFTDWSYCWRVSGYRTTLELWKEFKEDRWREATVCVAERMMRSWQEANIDERRGTSTAAAHALYLHEVGQAIGREDWCATAQRAFDWIFGVNKWNRSFVEGVGQNQWQRPVFGQFFPSTPQIPGGVLHVAAGEYDMPPVAFTLWACAELSR